MLKIRLAEIDTPERQQPFGTKAKQARVVEVTKDRYKRIVGRVYMGNLDVNAELVRLGYARVYRRYAKDKDLYRLEKEAQEAKRGLWASDHPIPPWEWRRGKRTVERGKTVRTGEGVVFEHGTPEIAPGALQIRHD
ncbi:MAG: thermonuclease family protein [Gammaproteobacteria bacterium]|nr:thermonuclease family protein [Gammaproteobacteria bacterium]